MPIATVQTCTSAQAWFPAGATGVAVTPNAGSYVNSSWVEVVSNVGASAIVLTGVCVDDMGTDANAVGAEFEVGVGAAGSEIPVGAIPAYGLVNSGFGKDSPYLWSIPIDLVPAGSRLAVRMRKSVTNTSDWRFSVGYMVKPLTGGSQIMETSTQPAYLAPTAASMVSTPGAGGASAAWANGAWVTLIAAPASDAVILGYAIQVPVPSGIFEYDLANGAAGSEVRTHTVRAVGNSGPALDWAQLVIPVDCVRVGIRTAVRMRRSTTNNTTAGGIKVCLMNKPL